MSGRSSAAAGAPARRASSDAAFQAAFEAARQAAHDRLLAARRSAMAGIGTEVAARLALAPVWTREVLSASALAPPDALDLLVDAGLATRSGDRYVVSEDGARTILADALDTGTVTGHLGAIAEAVDRARGTVRIPAGLDRFARLAAGGA
jgi:hypothetical protein